MSFDDLGADATDADDLTDGDDDGNQRTIEDAIRERNQYDVAEREGAVIDG